VTVGLGEPFTQTLTVAGYFAGAVGFLQNFSASSFDALVQARKYYRFLLLTLLATGIFFQIPVAVIGQPTRSPPSLS
jgi:Sec-independent protein secretion pathway component TatC